MGLGAGKGSSRESRSGADTRSCYGCGEIGHIRLNCRFHNAECENCGERGPTRARCRQPSGRSERAAYAKGSADIAFIAWEDGGGAKTGVWLVGSGSKQHITGDRSMFTSYRKLGQEEMIEGIGGEPLTV